MCGASRRYAELITNDNCAVVDREWIHQDDNRMENRILKTNLCTDLIRMASFSNCNGRACILNEFCRIMTFIKWHGTSKRKRMLFARQIALIFTFFSVLIVPLLFIFAFGYVPFLARQINKLLLTGAGNWWHQPRLFDLGIEERFWSSRETLEATNVGMFSFHSAPCGALLFKVQHGLCVGPCVEYQQQSCRTAFSDFDPEANHNVGNPGITGR